MPRGYSEDQQREVLAATLRPVAPKGAKAAMSSEVSESGVGTGRSNQAKRPVELREQPSNAEGAQASANARGYKRRRYVDTVIRVRHSAPLHWRHVTGGSDSSLCKLSKQLRCSSSYFVLVATTASDLCKEWRQGPHEDSDGLVYICRVPSRLLHRRHHRHLVYQGWQWTPLELRRMARRRPPKGAPKVTLALTRVCLSQHFT